MNYVYCNHTELSLLTNFAELDNTPDNFYTNIDHCCEQYGVQLPPVVQSMLKNPILFDNRIASNKFDVWGPISDDFTVQLPNNITALNQEVADFVAGFLTGLMTR